MDKKIILAPMAGITDLPFRLVCKQMGADIVYSEMISAAGIYYGQGKTLDFLMTNKDEWPVYFQLFGNDPKHFAKAAKLITKKFAKHKKKIGIDINFGCPVKKVLRQKAGCALMENPDTSKKIITSVLKNTDLPISIKIRAGYKKTSAMKFLENVVDLDWKTVIVHGRTFSQGFSGLIDFQLIKKIKKGFPGKNVIANGGIYEPENAKTALEKTKADGIAIAQGAMGNPWIFSQIKTYLETGKYEKPDIGEIKRIALEHAELAKKYKNKNFALEMRKHLGWYFKNIPGAKVLRGKIIKINNFKDLESIILDA